MMCYQLFFSNLKITVDTAPRDANGFQTFCSHNALMATPVEWK